MHGTQMLLIDGCLLLSLSILACIPRLLYDWFQPGFLDQGTTGQMELQVIMVVITATIWAIYWLGDTLFLKCHTTLCSERCEHLVASVNISKFVLAKHPLVMCLCLHALGRQPSLACGEMQTSVRHMFASPKQSKWFLYILLYPFFSLTVLYTSSACYTRWPQSVPRQMQEDKE